MLSKNWDRVHYKDHVLRNRDKWNEINASRKSFYAALRSERDQLKRQLEKELACFHYSAEERAKVSQEQEEAAARLKLIEEELSQDRGWS